MEKLNNKLAEMNCKKILDIGTRDGAFIEQIKNNIASYEEIIGIDISDSKFDKANKKFREDDNIKFEVMDAYDTSFPDNFFDLVCISNSLHHLEDIPGLIKEMKRIKKKDGLILISEIASDGQTGASLTHALIHKLDSEMDRLNSIYHHRTYSHSEIQNFVLEAGLKIVDEFDSVEVNEEKNASVEARVGKAFEKVKAFEDHEEYDRLYDLALKIQENYEKEGANRAIQYILFAK